jgi:hypothetical protein
MKYIKVVLIIGLIMLCGVSQAGAWSIELSPGGQIDVTGDTTFSVDVLFNPDPGGTQLDNYLIHMFYDVTELTWNSVDYGIGTNTIYVPFTNLVPMNLGAPFEDSAGHISNINAGVLGNGPMINSSVTLATVIFDINDPGVNIGAGDGMDVWFDTSSGGVTVDGNQLATPINEIITGSSPDVFVSAPVVPEPVSSTLFLAGAATLGFRRFMRKKRGNGKIE